MRLILIIVVALFIVLLGSFAYIASSEVSVNQQTVTQTIPNERFYNES